MITSVPASTSFPGMVSGTRAEPSSSGKRTDTPATSETDKKTVTADTTRELSEEEKKQAQDMERIDTHVRAHEAAHQGAAGGLARGKSFTYQQGPDGKQYAVAGEVQIDMSAVAGDPRATIAKMQRVRTAALSPSDPSPQDRQVAVQAARTEAQARAELLEQQQTERTDQKDTITQADRSISSSPQEHSPETDTSSSGRRLADIAQRFAAPSFSGMVFSVRA
jgi:hypothetical protein